LASTVSTRDGGIDAQCSPVATIITTITAMIAPTIHAQRRSAATATSSEACATAPSLMGAPSACGRSRRAGRSVPFGAAVRGRSLHRPARQVDEEVEADVDRDDDRGRDAGERERAARAAGDDLVDGAVVGARVGLVGHGVSPLVVVGYSGRSLRSSGTC